MAIDMRRVVEAAVEAAIKEAMTAPKPKKKRRLSTGRAVLLGAGLVTAGRIAAGPKARDMFGRVQQRITDADWFGDEPPDDIDDYEEELEDAGDYVDEPDAEEEDELEEDELEEDELDEEDGEFEEEDEADEEGLETERAD